MDKKQLLPLVRKFSEGIPVIDLKDAYPNVMDDLQVYIICTFSTYLMNHGIADDIIQYCIYLLDILDIPPPTQKIMQLSLCARERSQSVLMLYLVK